VNVFVFGLKSIRENDRLPSLCHFRYVL
jgi:hypothetical protein